MALPAAAKITLILELNPLVFVVCSLIVFVMINSPAKLRRKLDICKDLARKIILLFVFFVKSLQM